MDHEAMAEQFVGWARQRYGAFRHEDDTFWLGAEEVNQEQIANVVDQWAEAEGTTISRADAYAVAHYASHRLREQP